MEEFNFESKAVDYSFYLDNQEQIEKIIRFVVLGFHKGENKFSQNVEQDITNLIAHIIEKIGEGKFTPDEKWTGYITSIARNFMISAYRKKKRRKTDMVEEVYGDDQPRTETIRPVTFTDEEYEIRKKLIVSLYETLKNKKTKPKRNADWYMAYIHRDGTVIGLAEKFDVNLNTFRTRVRCVGIFIRDCLKEAGVEDILDLRPFIAKKKKEKALKEKMKYYKEPKEKSLQYIKEFKRGMANYDARKAREERIEIPSREIGEPNKEVLEELKLKIDAYAMRKGLGFIVSRPINPKENLAIEVNILAKQKGIKKITSI